MQWNYIVYVVCFLLAVFSVIKEYKRRNKQRLLLRVAVSLGATVALAAIVLPVTYLSDALHAGNEAVLLTPGFEKDSLNKYKNETWYTNDARIAKQYPKAAFVWPGLLGRQVPAIARMHVLGYGLAKNELDELNNLPIVFHQNQYPEGIISVSWTQKIKQGEHFKVQGTYNHTNSSTLRLVLKELNTTVDSVMIEQPGKIAFSLESEPKSTGKLIDHLLVLKGKDTVSNEPLPMVIDTAKPLQVLMLASAPGFENKFLKDWLSSRGFGVAVRSVISKDKISTQFINIEKQSLDHLSASALEKFDVLITDLSSLKSLNQAESGALQQQVNENGLGLIVKVDTILKSWIPFSIYKINARDQKAIEVQIQGGKLNSKITETDQLFINNKDDMQSLATDVQNHLLAGLTLNGSGKIVCTTLKNTYAWMLSGNKNDYAIFWSLLISKAAKADKVQDNLFSVTTFPTINSPVKIELETARQPGEVLADDAHLSLAQNDVLPFQWRATWWPRISGWNKLDKKTGQYTWIYVYEASDWTTAKAAATIAATEQYASMVNAGFVTKQIHSKVKITVPKFYFYILLLICCGFLWAEVKMR